MIGESECKNILKLNVCIANTQPEIKGDTT